MLSQSPVKISLVQGESLSFAFVRSPDIDLYAYENNERLFKVTNTHDLQSWSVMCVLDDISGRSDVQHVCHSTYVKRTTNDPRVEEGDDVEDCSSKGGRRNEIPHSTKHQVESERKKLRTSLSL